jgi:outer membrane protein TolC
MTRRASAARVLRWRRTDTACAALLLAALPYSIAGAQPALDGTPAPPLDSLIATALRRAPEIAAQRERAAAARQRTGAAAALDDPMVSLSLQDADFPDWTVGEADMSMLGVDLQQPLPFPGKRGLRRRAAAAAALVPAVEVMTLERQVTANVRTLYARLYALDRSAQTLASARASLRALEDATRARYAAGTAELEPQLAAQLAVSRLDERSEDVVAERRIVVAAMNRYLDRDAEAGIGGVATLPGVEPPPAQWQADALAHAPVVLAARAAIEAAERTLAVERGERRPDYTVGGGYGYRGDLGPLVTLRIGMDLPVWRRGRQGARIRAAEHELAAARHELRRAEAEARARAAQEFADWQRAEAQVRRYHDAIAPQSRAALDAARLSYQAGRGSFAAVIEAFNAWIQTQEEAAERETARFMAQARLAELVVLPAAAAIPRSAP